ncbi:acyltransferase family protein [Polymorphobacter arshaanensis]|uniref:acyltransferase family protein n=1 Tax=Glacieibacterium arshaanense TaxID=2511025 RepID=UPI00140D52EF|nr:acyltransferase [Polymorphobacter arshaanensis]
MSTRSRVTRFRSLDAMRGVAAIGVALMHWAKVAGTSWLPSGYLAVDMFFALSGFVIAHAYDQRIAAGLGARRFMAMRFIRLYPLYLLGTLVSVAMVATGLDTSWSAAGFRLALVFALLMLPMPMPGGEPVDDHGTLYPLNDPAWSLLFELIANLGFVLIHRWLSTRVLLLILGVAAVALLVSTQQQQSMERGWAWDGFGVASARVAFSFPLGVLVYRRFRDGVLLRWRVPVWVILAVIIAVMAMPAEGLPYEAARDVAVVLLVLPVLLVLGVNAAEVPATAPLFDWLGEISYPLYAVHGPLMALVAALAAKHGLDGEAVPSAPLLVLLVLLIALCRPLSRWFDSPARRWLTVRLGLGR